MPINTIFFDLDGTLYDESTGVWGALIARMEQYMREEVAIPAKKIAPLRKEYLEKYGTTLRGLHIHHNVDPVDYLQYVHDIPLEELIGPNRALDSLLTQLPQRKWIFTNANREHALRVIAALDLGPHFVGIFDIADMKYQSKPEPTAYLAALQMAGEARPAHSLFIDDRAENLAPARELGAATVLVGTREPHPAAQFSIPRLEALLSALPELVE